MQPPSRNRAPQGIMAVLAIVLAAIALAASVALPRIPGPPGTPGPLGPAGPGALIETSTVLLDVNLDGCTKANQVTIEVPSQGTVVVTSMIRLLIDHTQGTRDLWHARHATSPTDCSTSPDVVNYIDAIDAEVASDSTYAQSGMLSTPYDVVPGTYTFYLNVQMLLGMGTLDRVVGAHSLVVFHPNP